MSLHLGLSLSPNDRFIFRLMAGLVATGGVQNGLVMVDVEENTPPMRVGTIKATTVGVARLPRIWIAPLPGAPAAPWGQATGCWSSTSCDSSPPRVACITSRTSASDSKTRSTRRWPSVASASVLTSICACAGPRSVDRPEPGARAPRTGGLVAFVRPGAWPSWSAPLPFAVLTGYVFPCFILPGILAGIVEELADPATNRVSP